MCSGNMLRLASLQRIYLGVSLVTCRILAILETGESNQPEEISCVLTGLYRFGQCFVLRMVSDQRSVWYWIGGLLLIVRKIVGMRGDPDSVLEVTSGLSESASVVQETVSIQR